MEGFVLGYLYVYKREWGIEMGNLKVKVFVIEI